MFLYNIFKTFTRMERFFFGGSLLVFVVSFIFLISFYLNAHTVSVPVSSNQYTEGIIGQPIYINPVISGTNDADNDLSEIVYSDLTELTDYYKIDETGKIWNIFLKPDLKWSDGKPLTTDDIIYTIETIQDPNTRSPLYQTWQGVVAQRISELEIEFNLRTPYAFFLDNLKDLKIIPEHIFGTIPSSNFRLSDYNLEPIGSGPYKFISYTKRKDGFITDYYFTANDNFASTTPYIKNFNVKFFQDSDELISAFNSKKIDGFGDLNPKNITDIKISNSIIEVPMPRYYAIFFNTAANAALQDKNIRLAMETATDKKKIIEKVFDNKALVADGPILPTMQGYDPASQVPQEFSIEKSVQLLESNGWVVATDGVREKRAGNITNRLEFDLIVPQIPFLEETVNIIKEDWQAAGIKINPIILNPLDINNEVIKTRNYQMIIFGNILKNNPDIFSFWHSSGKFYPGLNLAIYGNKKVDDLLESIRKEFDQAKRDEALKTLQLTINSDKPAIFLFSPTYLYIGPRSLGGFTQDPITVPSKRLNNVYLWHLKTTRIFK
ncbi:MAG: peptide ABC transporter substrate-binding protein [Candidatus Pacebacteria bacterium]|nr:peptide ABC transporter substrate-binding protein [Candidatus Paceibacterota bacterium]